MRPRAVGSGLVVVVGFEALASISAAALVWAQEGAQAGGLGSDGGAVVRLVGVLVGVGVVVLEGCGVCVGYGLEGFGSCGDGVGH